jgi:hypothetical protein
MARDRSIPYQKKPRDRRKVIVTGEQSGVLNIPITTALNFNYDSDGKVDIAPDLSRHYRVFVIQSIEVLDGKLATIQINPGGGWVDCPTELCKNNNGVKNQLAATGGIAVVTMPIGGMQVRLQVAQPVATSNFSFVVLMDGFIDKSAKP